MPRPKASSHQELKAYYLHGNGVGPTAILKALEEEYGDDGAVSLRTINNWIRGFKEATKAGEDRGLPDLDIPFEWHKLDKCGLPWEASAYLLEMWNYIQEYLATVAQELYKPPPVLPTVRQVRWWWRVHLALPDVKTKLDIYLWAEDYVRLEIFRDVLGEPVDMAGYDAYLSYKPWIGQEKHEAYLMAVNKGRIPGVAPGIWLDHQRLRQLDKAGEFGVEVRYGVAPDRPEILPSESFAERHASLRQLVLEQRRLQRELESLRQQASQPESVRRQELFKPNEGSAK